ncbi:MAG: RNA polymerase sigma factor [Chloroflexi bacterium]|nr:RNA polymerase sigma factor [Chloroflexota bacterium]
MLTLKSVFLLQYVQAFDLSLDGANMTNDTPISQLIRLAKSGDQGAFRALYERYGARLYRFFLAYGVDTDMANDLVNETFIRLWEHLDAYQERDRFEGYLFRIARNLLIDKQRQENRFLPLDDRPRQEKRISPEENAIQQENLEDLHKALQKLKPDYRTVLILRFFYDYTPAQVAQVMERSEGAVRVLQHRALQALRKEIARQKREV